MCSSAPTSCGRFSGGKRADNFTLVPQRYISPTDLEVINLLLWLLSEFDDASFLAKHVKTVAGWGDGVRETLCVSVCLCVCFSRAS